MPANAAAAARDTLGGAVSVARQLGPGGAIVLHVARDGFVQGMQVVAAISAALAVGASIATAIVLRWLGTASATPTADDTSQDAAGVTVPHGGAAGPAPVRPGSPVPEVRPGRERGLPHWPEPVRRLVRETTPVAET